MQVLAGDTLKASSVYEMSEVHFTESHKTDEERRGCMNFGDLLHLLR